MRPIYIAFCFGVAANILVGTMLDIYGVWTHPVGLGLHLAVGIPAGFAGMFGAAWWLDRRRLRGTRSTRR